MGYRSSCGHLRRSLTHACPTTDHRPPVLARLRAVATWPGTRELLLIAALYVAYSLGRQLAADDLVAATSRARFLLDLERPLHLDVERALTGLVSTHLWLAVPAAYWYAVLHYVVTPATLVFLFVRHRSTYRRARTALAVASVVALTVYLLAPVAPPRLVSSAYVDVMAQTASWGWWSGHASAPAALGHLTNELAAMPSLHFGWALWVAWALRPHLGYAGRAVAWTYAAVTAVVVVGTGNHWVLDVVGGVAVVVVGIVLSSDVVGYLAGRQPRSAPDRADTSTTTRT